MDGLNKTNCGFASLCKLSADKCASCKVDKGTSDFHKSLCIGALTFDEVERMCGGKVKGGFGRKAKKGGM